VNNNKKPNIENIINTKRFVTSFWHRDQAEKLLDYALNNSCHNALIYAILESRIAIERYVFEISILTTDEKNTNEVVNKARKKNGVFALLQETTVNYVKHLTFCNIICEVNKIPIQIDIPNLKVLKKLITQLSKFCHPQFYPAETVNAPNEGWFIKGVSLVNKTIKVLTELVISGGIRKESMSKEVKEIYYDFLKNEIDKDAVRFRLDIIGPILNLRKLIFI